MKQEEENGVLVALVDELNEVLLRFLSNMDNEVYAERYTLEFNDSWDELICLSEELDMQLNGEVIHE